MVRFNTPRYEIDVSWDNRENAECPLNDIFVNSVHGNQCATVYYDGTTFWCHRGGKVIDDNYMGMTYAEIATQMTGLTRPLFVSRDSDADLSTEVSPLYNRFIGVVNLENGCEDDWNAFDSAITKALKDYHAWANNEIVGCSVYRITPKGKEYLFAKCGWYLEDLEDMVCTAEGELESDGYVAVNIPDDILEVE